MDLAAERQLIGAIKDKERIAVEVKSFLGPSIVNETQRLLGQIDVYQELLRIHEPNRSLVAALPKKYHRQLEKLPTLYRILNNKGIRKCVFDEETRKVIAWID